MLNIKEGILYSDKLSKFDDIKHGISTKEFASLSLNHTDNLRHTINERINFFDHLNIKANHSIFCGEQNHTDNIIVVNQEDEGKWTFDSHNVVGDYDAMITDKKNVNLVIFTADCMPVMIYDPVKKIIANVHSWWKWTHKKITIKTLEKMKKEFDTNPKDCIIYVGPSIWSCCYNVKHPDQVEAFKGYPKWIITRDWTQYINLWNIIESDLLEYGIPKDNIEISRICTSCHNDKLASHNVEWNKRITDNLSVITMI